MKKNVLITVFIILALINFINVNAQLKYDSVSYHSSYCMVVRGMELNDGSFIELDSSVLYEVDALFRIENGQVFIYGLDHNKMLILKENFSYSYEFVPNESVSALGYDNNLILCRFNLVHDNPGNFYVIRIDYSNARLIFLCNLTTDLPSDPYWKNR